MYFASVSEAVVIVGGDIADFVGVVVEAEEWANWISLLVVLAKNFVITGTSLDVSFSGDFCVFVSLDVLDVPIIGTGVTALTFEAKENGVEGVLTELLGTVDLVAIDIWNAGLSDLDGTDEAAEKDCVTMGKLDDGLAKKSVF